MGGGSSKRSGEQSVSVHPEPHEHHPGQRAGSPGGGAPVPTAGTLASDMSADSDGGKEDKAPAHVSNKTAHIKTMPENSNYEKSELDKFVLKVIPKDIPKDRLDKAHESQDQGALDAPTRRQARPLQL